MKSVVVLAMSLLITSSAVAQRAPRADTFKVIHIFPHDAGAFTQGLIYLDGHLYESTGLNGKSSVRIVDLTSGRVLKQYNVAEKYFGEGLTNWGNDLIQLTWQAELGFVYDRFTLAWKKSFSYKGEGWGLTHDDKQLILSDGTANLRFLDPQSFAEKRSVTVTDEKGQLVSNLNELEYSHGEVYANICQTDQIVRISPQTGKILGRIDLTGLIDKSELASSDAVLNGIAYDAKADRLFVTGKLWPKLFEIKLIRPSR
jgi:glutaminyl-peptide cyclotransferase